MPLRTQKLLAIAVAVTALLATLTAILLLRKNAATETMKDAEARLQAAEGSRIPIIDVHVHLGADGIDNLRGLMTRYGFDHVVNLSGGTPGRGLQEQLARAQTLPGKITTFVSLDYNQALYPDYGVRMTASLRAAHRMGAKGLKIAKVLGLALPKPAPGLLMPVDDPELDVVFEAAGELGMPIAIHSGDPRAFWQPLDERNERIDELRAHPGWALHGQPVPSFDEILDQLERRIARHPNTTFISVHFGNCAEDPDRVARMLRAYPNLYVDTAARIPEMGRHDPGRMRKFFEEFQDRILFGSDLGIGAKDEPLFLGSQGSTPPTAAEEVLFFEATHRYFETADRDFAHPTPIQGKWKISGLDLPRPILEKIYFRNAARLLNITL
jgi:predicted TIM-barrel fold metal-dependent hydrolase